MEKYHFNRLIERKNTHSVKWDMNHIVFGTNDILPMWVADMDFEPPMEVTEALKKRIEHNIYGYTFIPHSTYEAVQDWVKKRHHWNIEKDWLLFMPGVIPGISVAINALTEPFDRILVQSPVYTPFFNLIEQNGRTVVNSPLVLKDHYYEIDFHDFEEKLKSGVKLFILCNPHNPSGRVWKKEELQKIGELCKKYDCLILSDEIHSDLIYKPNVHTPIASVNEDLHNQVITFIAPSKTFNLAGLQASCVIIPNSQLRNIFKKAQSKLGYGMLNTFGIAGIEAAYRYGEDWLEQLLIHLQENIDIAKNFIEQEIPELSVMIPEGTYLLWIDCRKLGLSDQEIREKLIQKGKLGLEPGTKYRTGGESFVRMNIACSKDTLLEGLHRLKKAFRD